MVLSCAAAHSIRAATISSRSVTETEHTRREKAMGLIRKSLFLGTGGIVAPNSQKQRLARQALVAARGGSEQEIRRAGSRSSPWQFTDVTPQAPTRSPAVRQNLADNRAIEAATQEMGGKWHPAGSAAAAAARREAADSMDQIQAAEGPVASIEQSP
jgi:hypothetical protein